jgi:hypothetical protein
MIDGGDIIAFDRYLGSHRKADPIIFLAKGFDIFVGAWFLCTEIVGRKTYDYKPVFIFFI